MGIRCYCPNKHRLNLKSHLAGQRGICPQCGARFIIPLASDPSILPRSKRSATEATPGPEAGDFGDDEEGSVLVEQVTLPPTSMGSVSLPTNAEAVGGAAAPSQPMEPAPAVPAPPADNADPISAGGASMWYVRHATGGQYGPALPEVFRSWLAEGRIGPDSFVWREGWPEWKMAREVFAPTRPAPPVMPGTTAEPPELDFSLGAPGSVRPQRDRRKSTRLVLLVVLGLTVLALVPLLIVVINR